MRERQTNRRRDRESDRVTERATERETEREQMTSRDFQHTGSHLLENNGCSLQLHIPPPTNKSLSKEQRENYSPTKEKHKGLRKG